MQKSNSLVVLFALFVFILIGVFFVNKWLEREIQIESPEQVTINPTKAVTVKVEKKQESNAVKEQEENLSEDGMMSEMEKEFMQEKGAVHEKPLEDVILLQ